MKTILKLAAVAIFAVLMTSQFSIAQERGKGEKASPNAAVSQDIGTTTVSITYGRPGLKGRDLSTLAAPNKVWRTGANEATAITFSSDVMFGGEKVAAGTYSLYSIPGKNWTFILNKKQSWGTQYDEAEDLIRVPAAVTAMDAPSMEWFTIYFDNLSTKKAHLNLLWGTTKAAIPITVE